MMNIIHSCFKVLLVSSLLTIASTARAESDLLKDMVHFDQVYIPVLALTSDEKLNPARKALVALKPVWSSFKNQHYTNARGDKQWQTDLDKVDHYIKASEAIIARGTKLKDAHEELEHVRIVFMELRERHNIEYFVDHLTRYHKPMEDIVLAAKGKNEKTLTEKDIEFIRKTLPIAKRYWQATSDAKFDASLFEFSKTQENTLHESVANELKALNRLGNALQSGDKKQIISAGVAIKPNFAKIFKSFGHFPTGN